MTTTRLQIGSPAPSNSHDVTAPGSDHGRKHETGGEIFSLDKVIHYQALRNFLVTILVLGPGPNRFDDLRRDVEKTIEIFDVGIGGCGLSNAEAFVCFGRKDDGAQLVCFERVADGSPGRMDASVKERLLDSSQQMIGNHAKKNVTVDAALEMMKNWSLSQRRLHVAEQSVEPPKLVG